MDKLELLSGKKTLLIPLTAKGCMETYKLLLTNNKSYDIGNPFNLNPLSQGWLVKTKEGKATRDVGAVTFTPQTNISITIQMRIEPKFAQNLEKEIKKRYTYVEDGLNTALVYLGKIDKIHHVLGMLLSNDEVGRCLLTKFGFKNEGRLNHFIQVDDILYDLILMGWVRKDTKSIGKIPEAIEKQPVLVK